MSNIMIALIAIILIAFVSSFYFVTYKKSENLIILPAKDNRKNNVPPKPEERWRYVKEFENRHIKTHIPTDYSTDEEDLSEQLTDEQRQVLNQLKEDMRN